MTGMTAVLLPARLRGAGQSGARGASGEEHPSPEEPRQSPAPVPVPAELPRPQNCPTFCSCAGAVGPGRPRALFPAMLLPIRMWRWRRLQLRAGSTGNVRAGAERIGSTVSWEQR